jgi:hypothetical protein
LPLASFGSFAGENLQFNHTLFEFRPIKALKGWAIGTRKVG